MKNNDDVDFCIEPEVLHPIRSNTFDLLPSGKPNISFSEYSIWANCSWRHKLKFIEKIDLDVPGPQLDFGTAIHAAHEHFIKTKVIDNKVFYSKLFEGWNKHAATHPDIFTTQQFIELAKVGSEILSELPSFYDDKFPNWKPIAAEQSLFEQVSPQHNNAFKGYIDAIIEAPGARNKTLTWILDAKTCSWGWSAHKKQDSIVKSQLVFYKSYWSIKHPEKDLKDIRCAFVLLKKAAKNGQRCELFPVSVGETTIKKTLQVLNNMLTSIKKGVAYKNKSEENCKYCEYNGTKYCP